ncbi:rifin [Plasmodium reichenowi]|uniref:Rifin n=1 Tax=Plasmodium reichenowi TaxID=5854 RepID=A0A060RQI9_PLARE|nr:rifin [Plasmodium reichenowi]
MKLHYTKIFLFALPLNILVYNENKPYITPHHTQTNRSLCECDIQSSNYNNDADMKSVKECFDRKTSQRFEEYEERMKEKRQKRKEERDKNIEQIIKKDKMDKSLAEKIEKGCLKCGCALGGGVLPVWGLISGLWYATWKQYVATTVAKASTDAGIAKAIEGLKNFFGLTNIIPISNIKNFVTPKNYFHKMSFVTFVQGVHNTKCGDAASSESFCNVLSDQGQGALSTGAARIAEMAGETAQDTIATETAKFASQTTTYTTAIIASIVAILVIVLVMVIIYLILRYRRKKKMNKKLQYTKLLNK